MTCVVCALGCSRPAADATREEVERWLLAHVEYDLDNGQTIYVSYSRSTPEL